MYVCALKFHSPYSLKVERLISKENSTLSCFYVVKDYKVGMSSTY